MAATPEHAKTIFPKFSLPVGSLDFQISNNKPRVYTMQSPHVVLDRFGRILELNSTT